MKPHPYYITTAIPYVNAEPHIGFALELIQADVLARHQRARGRDVRFQTGSDDNSLKNARAAREQGVPVEALVRENADAFEALRSTLSLSYDDFIRTSSDPRHRPGVEKLWSACAERGDLYRSQYSGLYCVGCEGYVRPVDLVDGCCAEHLRPPEQIEEENVFFRLSRYAGALREVIESGELAIEPAHYRAEVLRLIDEGLDDFSVSRSRARAASWGLTVPGDPDQVIYVWFDALANYITALGYGGDEAGLGRYWCGDADRVHVIGKGITRFHAVYWPAILLSAGLPLPRRILVHGYLTVDGIKISKSIEAGSVVSPDALVEQVGIDAIRHFLVHHIRSSADGDFTLERVIGAHDSELADKLGNLVSRTTALVRRRCCGVVPTPGGALTDSDRRLIEAASGLDTAVAGALDEFRIHDASAAIWSVIETANRYVVETEPWKLPESSDRLGAVLYNLLECIRIVALQLEPFLPGASARILAELGAPGTELAPVASILFPKLGSG